MTSDQLLLKVNKNISKTRNDLFFVVAFFSLIQLITNCGCLLQFQLFIKQYTPSGWVGDKPFILYFDSLFCVKIILILVLVAECNVRKYGRNMKGSDVIRNSFLKHYVVIDLFIYQALYTHIYIQYYCTNIHY